MNRKKIPKKLKEWFFIFWFLKNPFSKNLQKLIIFYGQTYLFFKNPEKEKRNYGLMDPYYFKTWSHMRIV